MTGSNQESQKTDRKIQAVDKNRSLGKRLRGYFQDYCDGTSLIGFRYLSERRSKGERILWLLIISLSTGLSVFYVMKIFDRYVENPFIVNLATRESPIFEIPFPAVTICPTVKTKKRDFDYTGTINRLWKEENVTDREILFAQYFSLICQNAPQIYQHVLPPNKTFTDDIFESLDELNPKIHEVFASCRFMGEFKKCSNLFVPIVVDQGICYTFNMLNRKDIYRPNVVHYANYLENQNHTNWTIDEGYPEGSGDDVYPNRALLSGADNALNIILKQGKNETDYLCFQDTAGFSAHLHTPQTIPQLKKNFFSVPEDMIVQVIVKPRMMTTSEEVKNYQTADRNCYFTDERHLKFFNVYTPENCQLECLANHTLEKCHCVNFFMPRDNTTNICGNAMKRCMYRATFSVKEKEVRSQLSNDNHWNNCNCMPICTSLSYDTETDRTPYPFNKLMEAQENIYKFVNLKLDKDM